MLATARSCLPSPLKSPTATDSGRIASSEVRRGCKTDRVTRYWRRYCQRERPGCGLATAVESCDRHRVSPRRMRVRHPHHARRRIACQRALEVSRGGNIDTRGVCRRGIRRNRRVGAQRKGRVWIVAKYRGCHPRGGQQDRRDKDQSDRESDWSAEARAELFGFVFIFSSGLNVRFRKHPSRCRCRLLGHILRKAGPSCSVIFSAPVQTCCDVLTADPSSRDAVSFSSARAVLTLWVDY